MDEFNLYLVRQNIVYNIVSSNLVVSNGAPTKLLTTNERYDIMTEKTYICECGKEFTKPNSFNAHKSNCRVHFEALGKDIDEVYRKRADGVSKTLTEYYKRLKVDALNKWISEKHTCEKCGKVMTEKYGSGRFCSSSCAHGHIMTDEWRTHISNSLTGNNLTVKEFIINQKVTDESHVIVCDICGRKFQNERGLKAHQNKCRQNHNIPILAKVNGVQLTNITQETLDKYIEEHLECEICGRTVEEVVRYTGKTASRRLCVDHNHTTNEFRGMLCQVCNRQLGWYEKHKQSVDTYLNK